MLSLGRFDRRWKQRRSHELMEGCRSDGGAVTGRLALAPYQVIWVAAEPA